MGKFKPLLGLALLTFSLLNISLAFPSRQHRFRRSLIETNEYLDVLTMEIKKIPIEQFENDALLLQKSDPATSITTYILNNDNTTEIYRRESADAGKEVIVLTKDEDHLEYKKIKRRFVVLRLKPGEASPLYYVVYAYVRDASDSDTDKVTIDGETRVIEWDTWDYRGPGKERFATFGFSNCGPSAIVPCGSNNRISQEQDTKPLSIKQKWMPSSKFLNSPPNIKLTRFGTESGFDINDNFDLYGDLQVTKEGSGRSLTAPGNNNYRFDSDEFMSRASAGIPAWVGGPSGGFYAGKISYTYSTAKEIYYFKSKFGGKENGNNAGSGKGQWNSTTSGSGSSYNSSSGSEDESDSGLGRASSYGQASSDGTSSSVQAQINGGNTRATAGRNGNKFYAQVGSIGIGPDSFRDVDNEGSGDGGSERYRGKWKSSYSKETTKIKWEVSGSFDYGDGDDSYWVDFQPDGSKDVVPGCILNAPLSSDLPTDFQPSNSSDALKNETYGKMMPIKPKGCTGIKGWLHWKSEIELTVSSERSNCSYKWIFRPDPDQNMGEPATYYPDSNPEIGQPGIYFGPKPNGNVSGEFKPNNPSDPSMKETNHGKLVLTGTPDKAPIYGQMMPPEPPGGNNKFYPDADQTGKPKGRSFGGKPTINGDDEFAADFQPDSYPSTLIAGFILTKPLSRELPTDFQAAQPSEGPKTDTHGKLIPRKPKGSLGFMGTLHRKTEIDLTIITERCNSSYLWTFMPEKGEAATYYPDNNPDQGQPGTYWAPKPNGNEYGEFKPTNPSDPSMTQPNHGKMVLNESPNKTEIYGLMMPPESPRANNKFFPDNNDYLADFHADGSTTFTPGFILSPPLSSELPTDFQADQPNDALKIDTHGKMIPRKPSGSLGVLGTLHYKTEPELTVTTERSNASYQWIFKPDILDKGETATYYPNSNPEKGQLGTYWVPRPDAEYGEFKPTNPTDPSMTEKNHGRMVLNSSMDDPGVFGQMMPPEEAGAFNKLYPDKKKKQKGRSFGDKPSPIVIQMSTETPTPAPTEPPPTPAPIPESSPAPVGSLKGRSFGGKPSKNREDPAPEPAPAPSGGKTDVTGKVKAKGWTIANAKSITGKANAFAVSKTGNGAQANAINGSEATANAMATKQGDSQARAETYGAGGAKSNSLAMGTGVATGTALSRGKGNAQSNAVAAGGAAVSNALAAKGGNSSSNAVSNAKGNSLSSSVGLGGGVSRSSAIAMGQGIAKSNSLTEGGGNSYAVADARGGGGALSNSLAKQGAASHAISSSKGEGASLSNSVTKGGGNTRAEAMADGGDSIANAVQEDEADDVPFDPDVFITSVPNMPDENFNLIVPQEEAVIPRGKQKGRSFKGNKSKPPGDSSTPTPVDPQDVVDPTVYLPGWKMQYSKLFPNASFAHENEVFYGLGSCPYKAVPLSDLEAADSPEKTIEFYMGYLRSWCLVTEFDTIMTLIQDGAIAIEGNIMTVPLTSKFASKKKLTVHQLEELVMAFELSVFTKQFVEQKDKTPALESRAPVHAQITRSVRYLIDFILRGLDMARQKLRTHFVRLTRQLILVAKVTYAKLLQDFDALDACPDCVADKALNLNDRTEVMAVIEFMIKGLSPVDKGESSEASFEKFFKTNQKAIEIRVSTFAT